MFCAASEMGYVDEGSEDCRDLVHSYRNRLRDPSEYALLVRSLVSTLRHFPMSDMRSVFRAIAPHRRPIVVISGDEDATCPYQGAQEIAAMVASRPDGESDEDVFDEVFHRIVSVLFSTEAIYSGER